jgi:hypothetical protein
MGRFPPTPHPDRPKPSRFWRPPLNAKSIVGSCGPRCADLRPPPPAPDAAYGAGQRVIVQAHTPFAFGAHTGPAVVPSAQIMVGVAGAGVGHFSMGHASAVMGTQAQTEGELSKRLVVVQSTVSTHEHTPGQSAPPAAGSQESYGLSTQRPDPGHGLPASPPQATPSGAHLPESQWVPAAHFTVAHGSVGGGLQPQVGQPLASLTFPYSQ